MAVSHLVKVRDAPHPHPTDSCAQRRDDRHQHADDRPDHHDSVTPGCVLRLLLCLTLFFFEIIEQLPGSGEQTGVSMSECVSTEADSRG